MTLFDPKTISSKLLPAPEGIYRSFNTVLLLVGCVSLYGYFALKLPAIHAARIFLGLMFVAFLVSAAKAPRPARHDPAWYLAAVAICISLFIYGWSNLAFPEYAEPYPSTDNFLNLFLFFPVAWWLGGQTRNVMWLFGAAMAGFIVELVINSGWSELINGLAGRRVAFGIRNPQHTAIFFTVALLGWLLMVRRIVGVGNARKVTIRVLVWLGGIVFFGTGCIITQTRAAWIGFAAAFVVVSLIIMLQGNYSRIKKIIALLIILIVAMAVLYPQADTIKNRVTTETDVIHQLMNGEVDKLPYSSIGIRVHTWVEAWRWIEQRPITGWGYEARSRVIDESDSLPPWVVAQFGHFHNSYIEILLSYGLMGIALVAGLFGWVAREVWRTWKSGLIPLDLFLFGVAFAVFWMVVNLFESYVLWSTGVYLMALVGGSLYTFPLSARLKLETA